MPESIIIASPHPRHDALERNLNMLPGLEVTRIRTPDALTVSNLNEIKPRYVVFPHWSWKIPADVFESFECIIFHMTDVPFGRGGSPLQNLIVRGFRDTKLTALRCVAEMDAGDVYMKRDLSLEGSAEQILRRAADLTEEMILAILRDNPAPVAQTGEITRFRRRTLQDGDIAGLGDLGQVYNYIRMLDAEGYPPAFLEIGELRLEFCSADLTPDAVKASVRITRRSP
jgi:methionyl-tRNA formyltransferase